MWVLYEYLNSEGINKGIHDAKSYILSNLWENQMNISKKQSNISQTELTAWY